METVNYTVIIPQGSMTVIVPVKQMEIMNTMDKTGKETQWELLDKSKEIYKEKFPEEAKEFYKKN